MTSRPITATVPRALGCCIACLLDQTRGEHDTSLPVVQRASITAPVRRTPASYAATPLPGYGETDHYPAL